MSATTNTNTNNSSNNNSSNISSTSRNSNDVSKDSSSLFKYYIEKCYVLPLDLKNDIIYCQRAMRDFLNVHTLVSDVFKEQADADPDQMRRILDELQMEVHEINAEQQFLMLRLDEHLDAFYKKLEENNIRTVPDVGNAYISSLIVPLISDANYIVCPQSVLSRDTEDMLIRKHFLISQDDAGIEPLKLSELDDNVNLMLVNAKTVKATPSSGNRKNSCNMAQGATSSDPLSEQKLRQQLDEQAESIIKSDDPTMLMMMGPPPPPPRPMPRPRPMPLLKKVLTGKMVRQQQPNSLLASRGTQSAKVPPQKSNATQQQPPKPPTSTAATSPTRSSLVAAATAAAARQQRAPRSDAKQSAIKRISALPPVGAKVQRTLTPPPLTIDFVEVAQSRMNLQQALRRARKTKQQPRQIDEEDALELPSPKMAMLNSKTTTAATTAAAETTTLKQLNSNASLKSKLGKALQAAAKAPSTAMPPRKPTVATVPAPAPAAKPYKTRNVQGTVRKMTPPPPQPPPPLPKLLATQQQQQAKSTPGGVSSGSSDDLHQELEMELELEQQRLCASAAQWRDEPRESRVMPLEYGQENFLGLFGLYTHDMVKKLCQRHSKRKRRTVQNASGVDFHYGQQLATIDAVRHKKLKNKPEFLLSPKNKRLQAKKAHKAAAAAANRKSKSKTPEKLSDPLAICHMPDVGKQK
ncbi:probable basic-leucine zipper transcription factor R [Drosophila grimshawi]|uniref:GH12507 n=1 Tax=Drosophila grimshawi TaxID=7222 RepID=B4JJL1_DROGR|nr:probable basic-leucine zipper transcription factor R [Drosophila grimshawi]EDV99763.1 GH12507 [Drosophila grimshawi]